MKKVILRFREENRDIFYAIRNGIKKVETRAGSKKYQNIEVGDVLILSCGDEKIEKTVIRLSKFNTITDLLLFYKPEEIVPGVYIKEELEKIYHSFPGYEEKIKEFGIVAFEL